MEFNLKLHSAAKPKNACIIVGIFAQQELSPAAEQLNRLSKGHLQKVLKYGDFTGELFQTQLLYDVPNVGMSRVLLVGCGNKSQLDEQKYRKLINRAITTVKTTGTTSAICHLPELMIKQRNFPWKVRQAIECAGDVLYTFSQTKSQKSGPIKLRELIIIANNPTEIEQAKFAVIEGQAIVNGMNLAKDLGNLPGNICTPTYLSQQATQLAKQFRQIQTTILNTPAIKKLGMGAFLAVAQGSKEPPKLIAMHYQGTSKKSQPIVLVGKGITFDTGGISLKPMHNLDEMKFDMCGAASIFGTLRAIAEMKLPIQVIGLIPTCENMPDAGAIKPGDVVTSMSGQTIEILNTDAEGRLILCDALTYAKKYKPECVIDVATLTGAIILALGNQAAGLYSNNEQLTEHLCQASQVSCDRIWQMPLWEEYQESLASNFADMANIGIREGGSIIAASFLSRFTKDLTWAHLDIAGIAHRGGKEKGATGRPVPLLTQFLIDRVKK